MHLENGILGFPLTPLATMIIPEKNILACIPKAELWPLLVLSSLNLGVLDFLKIKLCHLNDRLAYRQDRVSQPDRFQMSIYFVLHRRRKPALRLLAISEACLTISRFPISSRTTKLTTG